MSKLAAYHAAAGMANLEAPSGGTLLWTMMMWKQRQQGSRPDLNGPSRCVSDVNQTVLCVRLTIYQALGLVGETH